MRATLLHNPTAGARAPISLDELTRGVRELGWEVRPRPMTELDDAVEDPGDVLLVAGGDGTVGAVAKRIAGKAVPMFVIPTGSVNNVARSLGIGVDPRAAIAGLAKTEVRTVDLGVTRVGGASRCFLEGFGAGVFAYVLGERATREDRRLRDAHDLLADEVEAYEAKALHIEVDGKDLTGDYLIAAVMNVRSLGPALALAPDAKMDDGELDVVLVREGARDALVAHLRRAAEEGDLVLPTFETHRARHVRMKLERRWTHTDDQPDETDGEIVVDVMPGAVRVVVPKHGD